MIFNQAINLFLKQYQLKSFSFEIISIALSIIFCEISLGITTTPSLSVKIKSSVNLNSFYLNNIINRFESSSTLYIPTRISRKKTGKSNSKTSLESLVLLK